MIPNGDSEFKSFSEDAINNAGYMYTTNAKLSSYLANQRLTDIALEMVDFKTKKVLDVGCGDGTYTLDLLEKGQPSMIHGIDISPEAIELAQQRIVGKPASFEVRSADKTDFATDSYDIVHMRGILHHMNNPAQALIEAIRIAPEVIVIEPNGYNPILKVIERTSRYHIEHQEKSYRPKVLKEWTRQAGGIIRGERYVGLVPFFCPSLIARILKIIEPIFEKSFTINMLSCAVYAYTIERVR